MGKSTRYFLCSNSDEQEIIKGTFKSERIKMLHEGGKWTTRCSAETLEELYEKQGILPDPCVECGRLVTTSYMEPTKSELIRNNICFSCRFWRDYEAKKDDSRFARIDGTHYCIADERKGGGSFSGFGGSRFVIKFKDGRVVTTTNLWHQGSIPSRFRDRLPDNAEFVKPSATPHE